MPWTYLAEDGSVRSTPSAASGGSPRPSAPGATTSPTASGSGPARPSSYPECFEERSTEPPSGTTSAPWIPPTSPGPSTSSSAGSPARTSPTPGRDSAWEASAPSFTARACALLGHFDPATSSLRTSQLSLFEAASSSLETLPPSGMIAGGSCYELRTPIPPRAIAGSGGSVSPSDETGFRLMAYQEPWKVGRGDPEKRDWQDVELWPTPTFSDGKMDGHGNSPQVWKSREIRKAAAGIALQFTLGIAVRVARMDHGWAVSRDLDSQGRRLEPTQGPPGRRGRGTSRAGRTISPDSRVLNPLFLAMLMGFGPTDVTLLAPTVMESMSSRRGSRSATSSPAASARSIEP